MSEHDYLASFQTTHPARAALGEITGKARADLRAASLWDNPVGSFEREAPGDFSQNTWSLSWTPPLDGRRSARKDAATVALHAAEYEQALASAELHATLRETYASWALASERAAILGNHTERIRKLVVRVTERAVSGEESRLSARRIALAVVEIEAETARAEVEKIDAESEALGWLGDLNDDLRPVRPELPDEKAPTEVALTLPVTLRRAQVGAAESNLRSSGRYLQFPQLMFGWETIAEAESEISGPVMGLMWPIPLFDRRQGDRDAARASLSSANARVALETNRVTKRLAAASERYGRLRTAALAAMDSVAIADRVLQSAAARFEAGESDVTELLETLRGIISARLAAVYLYSDALAAHRELELLIGRSWPAEDK